MKNKLWMGAVAAGVLAMVSGTASASNVYDVGSLAIMDLGTVNPATAPTMLSGSGVTLGAETNASVQAGQYPNNVAFDPYGTGDTTHNWLAMSANGSAASATFSFAAPETTLSLVWGSPSLGNFITLYSGANGTGNVVGTVTDGDLLTAQAQSIAGFGTINNTSGPGDVISIAASTAFQSAVFNSKYEAFEVAAISAVPLPGAVQMFVLALVAFAGFNFWASRREKGGFDQAV